MIDSELKQRLKTLLNKPDSEFDEEDEEDLLETAGELLSEHAGEFYGPPQYSAEETAEYKKFVRKLRKQVVPYQHDPSLPALDRSPDGQLDGVGFIYDEDRDDRVLSAIDKCKRIWPTLVAVAEHEGTIEIFTRELAPYGSKDVEVFDDTWTVNEYVPYRGAWHYASHDFIRRIVAEACEKSKPQS